MLGFLAENQILGGAILGAGGWLANEFFRRRQERRVQRLERLDTQIREFYGPLFAEVTASEAIWQGFGKALWPEHGFDGYGPDNPVTTEEERERWRTWVREVFMPINLRIEKILMEKADLLEGTAYPKSFQDLLAHIAGYKVVMMRWDAGDFSKHTSLNNWPSGIVEDVTEGLSQAQAEQKRLLTGLGLW